MSADAASGSGSGVLRLNALATLPAESVRDLTDGRQKPIYNLFGDLPGLPLFVVARQLRPFTSAVRVARPPGGPAPLPSG